MQARRLRSQEKSIRNLGHYPFSLSHDGVKATRYPTQRLSLIIREELPEDLAAIREVNQRAFSQDQEGNIVDALRSNGAALLSLVATLNGKVMGHSMYSPTLVGGTAVAIDLKDTNLSEYRNLHPSWHDWARIKDFCQSIAIDLFQRL